MGHFSFITLSLCLSHHISCHHPHLSMLFLLQCLIRTTGPMSHHSYFFSTLLINFYSGAGNCNRCVNMLRVLNDTHNIKTPPFTTVRHELKMQHTLRQINDLAESSSSLVSWLHILSHYCIICNLLADEFSNYISNELPQKHFNLYLIQLTLLAIHHLYWH